MPTGIGVNLGAIQTDGTETPELVLPRDLQYLRKGGLKFLAKVLSEACQSLVIRMPVASDIPEGQRNKGRPPDLAAGECPGSVAVDNSESCVAEWYASLPRQA